MEENIEIEKLWLRLMETLMHPPGQFRINMLPVGEKFHRIFSNGKVTNGGRG